MSFHEGVPHLDMRRRAHIFLSLLHFGRVYTLPAQGICLMSPRFITPDMLSRMFVMIFSDQFGLVPPVPGSRIFIQVFDGQGGVPVRRFLKLTFVCFCEDCLSYILFRQRN